MANASVNGTIGTSYGVNVTFTNAGTRTTAYGLYVTGMGTGGTWTNTPYDLYMADAGAFNYFAGHVGIGVVPKAASPLRVSGLPTSAAGLAAGEVWSNGGVLTIV
jgi:hypothetical protein